MQAGKKAGFQTDINGLRGVAVLLVVLYHFNIGLLGGGFIGVDIFFVISGYLMTKIVWSGVSRGQFSYIGFLYRRGTRIFPALFALVLALLLLGAFLLPPPDLASLARQAVQALIFNSNNYYAAQQGYFSAGIDDRWLLHTWSLSVEWQFYMIYPLIILLGMAAMRAVPEQKKRAGLLAFLSLVALASFAYCQSIDNELSFFSVLARCWQMLAGGMVFLLASREGPAPRFALAFSYLGTLLLIVSVAVVKYLNLESSWPGYFALLPVLGTCLVLFSRYEYNRLLGNAVMQRLGDASYSIYLWHWPVVIALTVTGLLEGQPKASKVGGFVLSLILGYLSYRFVEPVRRLKTLPQWSGLGRLVGAGAVLAGAAFLFLSSGGLAFRVNDGAALERLQLAEASHTYDPACENEGELSDRFCLINKGQPGKKILVIGDSHAGHLYAWFQKNSRVDTTFFVKSGCPAIIGFELAAKYRNCHGYAEKAFALAVSGTYQKVIISENWTGFGNDSDGICRYTDKSCITPAAAKNGVQPVAQLRQTIEQLMAAGIDVAVVDATPYFHFNVPRKLWRDQYWFGKSEQDFASTAFFEKNADYDKLFADLQQQQHFRLLSFRPQLCKNQRCAIYDASSKTAIYKDQDHFNPAWVRDHGEILQAYVNGS